MLSGTPASDTGGVYNLTFTAHNGVGSDATQPFTLTVNQATQAPAITSANSTTFAVGTAGTLHGDGHRRADPDAERERHVAQRRDIHDTNAPACSAAPRRPTPGACTT